MRKLLYFCALCFVFSFGVVGYAGQETPRFTFDLLSDKYYTITNDVVINGSVKVVNVDPARWAEIELKALMQVEGGGIVFTPDPSEILDPFEEHVFDFQINVGPEVCTQDAEIVLIASLKSYEDPANAGNVGNTAAIGVNIYFDIAADSYCISGSQRLVFHDVDGDGVYEEEDGDEPIVNGYAYFYDDTDTLLSTADLSLTGGLYTTPIGSFTGPKDFYLTVDTQLMDGAELDKDWYENVFVNRYGDYGSLGSTIFFNDVNSYAEVLSSIPMRSRNTDQSGDWDLDTLSIGPDDKDQIISPVRWDYLVDTTDFKYADLDYDGRIDPDDKDHIISPLYWDFPN